MYKRTKNYSISRAAMTFVLMVLTTATAWAEAVTLTEDTGETAGTAARWYVNMPQNGTNTLTLSDASITVFKVYDDGGKGGTGYNYQNTSGGNYSNACRSTLTLTAPDGYVLLLSGTIKTEKTYDKLTVYDGNTTSGTKLLDAVSSSSSGAAKEIETIASSGQSMTLYFYSDNSTNYDGLDLTVTLYNPNGGNNITISNPATGGTIASDKSTAMAGETVTLTATPATGYLLSSISVVDAGSEAVSVTGGWYTNSQATFTMPGSAVTVTPTFTNDMTDFYINMPATGTKNAVIPLGVQSFKVYDDGGADGYYSNNCDGTLVLTAPKGYQLRLSGYITVDLIDKLTVWDGIDTSDSGTKLLDAVTSSGYGDKTAIKMVTSSGRSMTLFFHSDPYTNYAGLNLKVTLINTAAEHSITVNNPTEGGSVASNLTSAAIYQTVTLTATPASGYQLSGISVVDENNDAVDVTDMLWYANTNTATFTMPATAVTVTPTFTSNKTAAGDDALFINMLQTGTKNAVIPAGVQSFKVYDDGGKDGNYSLDCNSTLVLTAPTGYVFQLSGSITAEAMADYLTVYDGTSNSGTKLLDRAHSDAFGAETAITTVVSSGQSMTLYFHSNWNFVYAGLDLTVSLFNTNETHGITVSNSITGGTVTASHTNAAISTEVTLTATPETGNGYMLNDIRVVGSSGSVSVTGGTWYTGNTATFSMPSEAVTVIPSFTQSRTADDLFINMLKTGTKTATIPADVTSFKVYDDGGANAGYSSFCNDTLVLTAPTGYALQLSGSIQMESYDVLTVYDGTEANDTKLLEVRDTHNPITTVISTTQSMTLCFYSEKGTNNYAGLDLTVTLIPNPYTVSFNANSGTGDTMATMNFTYGVAQTLSACTYTPPIGYSSFAGWATTADGDVVYTDQQSVSNLTAELNGNVELYAKWIPFNYTITYNLAGGTVADATPTTYTIESAAITLNNPTRTGYDFAGWTGTDLDAATTTVTVAAGSTGNRTYTATWTPSETISLTANTYDGNYWTTFYCGDAGYEIDNGENAWAYTAEVGTDVVVLHKLGKVIPAGNAVIIVSEDGNVSMTKSSESVATIPTNHLHGVDVRTATNAVISSITDAETICMMSKQDEKFGFFKYKGTNVPARKAFLALDGSAAARQFIMVFEETTGIGSLTLSPKGEGSEYFYTLDGRRLDGKPTQRGVYISGGRKIVIK